MGAQVLGILVTPLFSANYWHSKVNLIIEKCAAQRSKEIWNSSSDLTAFISFPRFFIKKFIWYVIRITSAQFCITCLLLISFLNIEFCLHQLCTKLNHMLCNHEKTTVANIHFYQYLFYLCDVIYLIQCVIVRTKM